MNKSPGRGRRAGGPDTREQILETARRLFLANGYGGTTMRAVAAEADVDAALISYFFGSKRGLFGAALALTANPLEVARQELPGDLATLPERALTALLQAWDDPCTGEPLVAMLRGVVLDPGMGELVREAMHGELLAHLAERLGGVEGRRRAALFGAQMGGLIFTRYLLRLEPIASMNSDEIIRMYTPALRAVMFGPRPGRAVLARTTRTAR
ncbi:TetR/AcrR family transcriptional regulator [Actinospica robiniae]|uniref:Transcriptional regulator n=1 Tax=Actinospica robiniae DSM 44927 TaxID=479430 RepID=W9E4Z7_9ACTN|nr:TetR family transcriptional regulator [Actinospica robiniae]ETA71066.1 transcriptional regulator [Actinospica robiniae DSM 44927]